MCRIRKSFAVKRSRISAFSLTLWQCGAREEAKNSNRGCSCLAKPL